MQGESQIPQPPMENRLWRHRSTSWDVAFTYVYPSWCDRSHGSGYQNGDGDREIHLS